MRKLMILLLAFVSMAIFAQVGQVNIDEIALNVSTTDFVQNLQMVGFEREDVHMYGYIEPYGECMIDLSMPKVAFINLPECNNWQDSNSMDDL